MFSTYANGEMYQVQRRSDGKLVGVTPNEPRQAMLITLCASPTAVDKAQLETVQLYRMVNQRQVPGSKMVETVIWVVEDEDVDKLLKRGGNVFSVGGQLSVNSEATGATDEQ